MNLFTPDLRQAAADAILASLGAPTANPHPFAHQFADAPLARLAEMIANAERPPQSYEHPRMIQARGMISSDFSATVATAAQVFAAGRYRLAAEHLTFCHLMQVKDFKPHPVADLTIAAELQQIGESGEVAAGRVVSADGTMTAQLASFATVLPFSRQLVVNESLGAISATLAALGSAAARAEAKLVYAALEANPTMQDGGPAFHADYGNIVASALDEAALGTAMDALRRGGETLGPEDDARDLPAAHLVVAGSLEVLARRLVHQAGLPLTVTATARLPSARWYLLPSPELQPVVSVLRLGKTNVPVALEQGGRESGLAGFDGFAVRAGADLGATLVSRYAVRGGA